MKRKSIYLMAVVVVAVVVIASLVVLWTVPLKTVTEDFGERIFTLKSYDGGSRSATDTLNVKKGWTVSGNFSSSCVFSGGGKYDNNPDFVIYSPDMATVVYEETGSSSGTFSFVANVDGGYRVVMTNLETYFETIMTVTFEARQTGTTTIL